MPTIQASKVTLGLLERQFGLSLTDDVQAFPEWQVAGELEPEALRALDDLRSVIDHRVKRNYTYLLKEPPVLEETVKLVVLSPLLDLAGFYQPPFRMRTEESVIVTSQDEDGVEIRGAIDAIVVLEKIWVVVIEAKMSDFSLTKALPQTLSYMLASPNVVTYGLVTNGSEFMFLKLTRGNGTAQYATSRVASLLAPGNELAIVLQGLQELGKQVESP
jgi:predicted type IV restriction endonuclease